MYRMYSSLRLNFSELGLIVKVLKHLQNFVALRIIVIYCVIIIIIHWKFDCYLLCLYNSRKFKV